MVMVGGAFQKGFKMTPAMRKRAERTRMINKARKAKGLAPLTASQKQKLNKGLITAKSLLKGGFDDTMQYVAGFDDTMQYVGGARRRRAPRRKMKGSGLLGNLGAIGDQIFGLGGAMKRSGRPSRKKTGAGLLTNLGEVGDSIFGLGGVEMGGAMKRRGRPRRKMAGGANSDPFADMNEIFEGIDGMGEGGAMMRRGRGRPRKMKGSGILGNLGEIGDSIFGLGGVEMGGRVGPRRKTRAKRGGLDPFAFF